MSLPKSVEEVALVNAQEVLVAERKLRALRITEQEALTEKAQIELKTQQIILELTEEHQRTVKLPELKLS